MARDGVEHHLLSRFIISRCRYELMVSSDLVLWASHLSSSSGWYRASRTPLRKGFVTESIDGQPVSNPLLGSFTKRYCIPYISLSHFIPLTKRFRDVGSMRVHTLPNFWIHASGDHAVATR